MWLANLKRCPYLKPEQKIQILKENVIDKMQHTLRLSEAGISKLKVLNRKLKIWFKQVLHLPVWTNDSWIYARSGGNLHDVLATILACRKEATEKMLNSEDSISFEVGNLIKNRVNRDFEKLKSLALRLYFPRNPETLVCCKVPARSYDNAR